MIPHAIQEASNVYKKLTHIFRPSNSPGKGRPEDQDWFSCAFLAEKVNLRARPQLHSTASLAPSRLQPCAKTMTSVAESARPTRISRACDNCYKQKVSRAPRCRARGLKICRSNVTGNNPDATGAITATSPARTRESASGPRKYLSTLGMYWVEACGLVWG